MLKVLCPHCHQVVAISKVQPGAVAQCPFCTGHFRVPAVQIIPAAPPPAPAPLLPPVELLQLSEPPTEPARIRSRHVVLEAPAPSPPSPTEGPPLPEIGDAAPADTSRFPDFELGGAGNDVAVPPLPDLRLDKLDDDGPLLPIPAPEPVSPEDGEQFEVLTEDKPETPPRGAETPKEDEDSDDGYEMLEEDTAGAESPNAEVAEGGPSEEEEANEFEVVQEDDDEPILAELAEPQPAPAPERPAAVPVRAEVLEPEPAAPPVPDDDLADKLQPQPAVSVPPLPVAIPLEPPRASRQRRRRRPRLEEDDDEEDSDEFRPPSRMIPGLDNFIAGFLAVVALWVLLGVISLVAPPVGLVLVGLGILLAAGGQIWFLIVAFQEDTVTGLLCIIVPLYSLVFLIAHLDVAGRPFVVNMLGSGMLVSGLLILHMVGAT